MFLEHLSSSHKQNGPGLHFIFLMEWMEDSMGRGLLQNIVSFCIFTYNMIQLVITHLQVCSAKWGLPVFIKFERSIFVEYQHSNTVVEIFFGI